jgi:hypothetical protein
MKLSTQFLLTALLPRSLSSLLAISLTSAFEEGMLREDSLSTRCIITSSSSFVRRFEFGSQSRRERRPARRLISVLRGTLYVVAARLLLWIC